MCSETSPRVSFSNDLGPAQEPPMEQNETRRDSKLVLDSSPDFEFRIYGVFDQEPSSADELFSNGMILPFHQPKNAQRTDPQAVVSNSIPPVSATSVDGDSKKSETRKSFWGFNRTASLNCDKKKSLIGSLPLLSRSNSTGSVQSQKQKLGRVMNKQSSLNQSPSSRSYQFRQKPPLKKNVHGGSYGNGVSISPVLNVPLPYISKGTANPLGFGSFLRYGQDKKNKK